MIVAILYILAGIALLYFGGESLVRGAAGLALRLGLAPLAVGLTVVAFGTSCPELAVSMLAARDGAGDVAAGNVIGSNIANIGLILGLTSLISPLVIHKQITRFDLPVLLLVTIGFLFASWDFHLTRLEGGILFGALLVYIGIVLRIAKEKTPETKELTEETEEELPPPNLPIALLLFYIVVGLVMLVGGGYAFVEGATELARQLNVSEALIGLTVVAFGTSLPELAASVIAATKGHGDIAVGNVIGSNLFNLLNIMGLTSLIYPLTFKGINPVDMGVMLGMTVVLIPLFMWGRKLNRVEGILLLVLYGAYVGWRATQM